MIKRVISDTVSTTTAARVINQLQLVFNSESHDLWTSAFQKARGRLWNKEEEGWSDDNWRVFWLYQLYLTLCFRFKTTLWTCPQVPKSTQKLN